MTGNKANDPDGPEPLMLQQLMLRVARQDSGALAELYRRTSGRLYAICLSVLRSDSDAEEVLQEVYVSLWRRAGQYDPARAGVMSWIAVIARNRAIDRLRGRLEGMVPVEGADDIPDDGPSAFEIVELQQARQRLDNCLEELEEKPRSAIRTAFFEGLSYSDLAAREDVPLGTMKSWIRRGLLRLKGCLER